MKDTFERILAAYRNLDCALHANAADDEATDHRRKEIEKLLLKARAATQAVGALAWAMGTMSPITEGFNTCKAFDTDDYAVNYDEISF